MRPQESICHDPPLDSHENQILCDDNIYMYMISNKENQHNNEDDADQDKKDHGDAQVRYEEATESLDGANHKKDVCLKPAQLDEDADEESCCTRLLEGFTLKSSSHSNWG